MRLRRLIFAHWSGLASSSEKPIPYVAAILIISRNAGSSKGITDKRDCRTRGILFNRRLLLMSRSATGRRSGLIGARSRVDQSPSFAIAGLILSAFISSGAQLTVTSTPSKAPSFQDVEPIPTHTDESKHRKAIFVAARQQLTDGDFDTLEKTAQAFRDSKESYIHGSWALKSFYLGVADIDYSLPDAQCIEFLNKIRAWISAKPNSATAHIALAHALIDYAWKARGIGWGDSVSGE